MSEFSREKPTAALFRFLQNERPPHARAQILAAVRGTENTVKICSIKENYIFRRAYHKGKSWVCPLMVVYELKSRRNYPRLGITVTKKQGNAPTRNRIRRIIRAAFAAQRDNLPNADLIVVARARSAFAKSTDIEAQLIKMLRERA